LDNVKNIINSRFTELLDLNNNYFYIQITAFDNIYNYVSYGFPLAKFNLENSAVHTTSQELLLQFWRHFSLTIYIFVAFF